MAVQSIDLYAQVTSDGLPWWRLQLSNWGNRGAGADADSIAYAGTIAEAAGVVIIGPDSTADQAVIDYTRTLSGPAIITPTPGALNQRSFTVGINKPGVALPGPLTVRSAFSTMFTDTYFKDGSPTELPFGTTEPLFEAPNLQLLFYPGQPIVPPYTKRNDMYRSSQTQFLAGTAEVLMAIWPVMGRSCKSLYFRATNDLVATVRVGAIVDYVTTQVGVAVPRAAEDTVNTVVINVNGTTGVQASVTTGRPMQWIGAYATRASGQGFINTQLIAQDC